MTTRFDILGILADGGMAEIALAVRRDDGLRVALKRIRRPHDSDPEFVAMFADEARVWERLRHPNVVRLIEHGQDEQGPYIAVELVDGLDLATVLSRHAGQALPLAFVLSVAAALADALAYLHEVEDAGGCELCLVHRDVSPGNLLCGSNGAIKLTDFGVAQVAVKSHATRAGDLKGKFAYMSPEQTRGEALSPASDLFSAGILLWELLAGRPLFDRATDLDTAQAVRDAAVPALDAERSDVPEALQALIARLLARDIEARPSSAAQLAAEIRRIARDAGLALGAEPVLEVLGPMLEEAGALEARTQALPRRRTQLAPLPSQTSARGRMRLALVALLGLVGMTALWAWQGEAGVATGVAARTDASALALAPIDAHSPARPDASSASAPEDAASAESAPAAGGPLARLDASVRDAGRRTARRPPVPRPARDRDATRPGQGGFGSLDLHADPWAKIAIDGVAIGRNTPLRDFSLAAGRHRVTLHNPVFDITRTIVVEIEAGQRLRRSIDLTEGSGGLDQKKNR